MNQTYPEQLNIIQRHQSAAPVQTVALADELGLKVWHVPNWPDDLSGKIIKSAEQGGSSGYAIYVNKGHHIHRRRFTTAHEIAHFILHRQFIGDGIVDDGLYRSRLSNYMEVQANKMAADILMPRHLINQHMSNGVNSVSELAKIFQVSESAMSFRVGSPN